MQKSAFKTVQNENVHCKLTLGLSTFAVCLSKNFVGKIVRCCEIQHNFECVEGKPKKITDIQVLYLFPDKM